MRYFIFLSFTLLYFSACFLPGNDCFKDHLFTIDFNLSPAQDTFHVGDTIWISSTIPEFLINEESGEEVNLSGSNLPILFSVDKVDTTDFAPIEDHFSYVYQSGNLNFQQVSTFSRIYLSFDNVGQEKNIEFGLIPTKKSVVMLSFYWKPSDLERINLSDCTDEISLTFNTNNRGDNNYHMIEESNNPLLEIEKKNYDLFGSYTFVVIE